MKSEGHSELVSAAPHEIRYTQMLLAVCTAASLTLLLAFNHAVHRIAVGGAFTWLALGASAALFCFLLLFVEELSQTGDVIASFEFLRSLRLPRDLLKLAAATAFLVGSLKLTRQLKSRFADKPM
jgi:hypothetical protein